MGAFSSPPRRKRKPRARGSAGLESAAPWAVWGNGRKRRFVDWGGRRFQSAAMNMPNLLRWGYWTKGQCRRYGQPLQRQPRQKPGDARRLSSSPGVRLCRSRAGSGRSTSFMSKQPTCLSAFYGGHSRPRSTNLRASPHAVNAQDRYEQ